MTLIDTVLRSASRVALDPVELTHRWPSAPSVLWGEATR
jgi:hypothetical protein